MVRDALELNLCPPAAVPGHHYAENPRLAVGLRPVSVLGVVGCWNVSQVGQPVIAGVAVDMVDAVLGPVPVDVHPDQPMYLIRLPMDFQDKPAAIRVDADRMALPGRPSLNAISQDSGMSVIAE